MELKTKIPKFNFENPSIKTIDIILHSVNVETGGRRLRATWTPELAQDLNTYHNIDAEAELTALLSEHVATEINREIINDLIRVPNFNLEPHSFGGPVDGGLTIIQPLSLPMGHLFYLDYVYGDGNIEDPIVYDDGSWSVNHEFDGVIGIKTKLEPLTF